MSIYEICAMLCAYAFFYDMIRFFYDVILINFNFVSNFFMSDKISFFKNYEDGVAFSERLSWVLVFRSPNFMFTFQFVRSQSSYES